jgi:hypothetical protein
MELLIDASTAREASADCEVVLCVVVGGVVRRIGRRRGSCSNGALRRGGGGAGEGHDGRRVVNSHRTLPSVAAQEAPRPIHSSDTVSTWVEGPFEGPAADQQEDECWHKLVADAAQDGQKSLDDCYRCTMTAVHS